jgi:hypothetical protein
MSTSLTIAPAGKSGFGRSFLAIAAAIVSYLTVRLGVERRA